MLCLFLNSLDKTVHQLYIDIYTVDARGRLEREEI